VGGRASSRNRIHEADVLIQVDATKHFPGKGVQMKRLIMGVLLATLTSVLAESPAPSVTINGYVIDSACLFLKNLDKPISKECALNCAKAGSPLVILADDGTVYIPISSEMPATGQNERLMKFAGGKAVIKGRVFERGGSHAIVIEEINAAPVAK
jgi:hypothetical protein